MSKKDIKEASDKNLPMAFDMENDAGAGFENVDKDTFVVPRIAVLQSNSPQVDDEKPEYIDGARAGMLFNTATSEVYDGKAGLKAIICSYTRKFIEWADRVDGGGIQNIWSPAEAANIETEKRPEKNGNKDWVVGTNNNLEDTREHAVIITVEGQDPFPALMSFTSTQIKKSKAIMTQMNQIKMAGKGGSKFTPPLFAHEWHLTTVGESNKHGDWKGYKLERIGFVQDAEMYAFAKDFADQVKAGEVKAAADTGPDGSIGQPDDGGPAQF